MHINFGKFRGVVTTESELRRDISDLNVRNLESKGIIVLVAEASIDGIDRPVSTGVSIGIPNDKETVSKLIAALKDVSAR